MSSKEKIKPLKGSSKHNIELPTTSVKDPSVPTTTTKNDGPIIIDSTPAEPPKAPWWKKCCNYMYDPKTRLFCGRSCSSWWYMTLYSIMYIIFLSTFTMICLYATLTVIKMSDVYHVVDKSSFMAFLDHGLGLTATPTALDSYPLISYTNGLPEEYSRYVQSLDELLVKRRKRQVSNLTDLGPCGAAPYGYGAEPCVIIRPNKHLNWSAKPLKANSTEHLPEELQRWLQLKEQKLWLHCSGYHSYDKEHIGRIKYHPYPPGFDPSVFPLDMQSEAPLIAIQISNFTLGLSLTVECKMWYDSGVSSVAFLLYVEPKSRSVTIKNDVV